MYSVRKPAVVSSTTSPSSRKRSGEYWMYASGKVICRALQKLRTARRGCWPTAVPIAPMDAPITPAGMWGKEFCLTNCAMATTSNILWHHLLRAPELHKPDLDPHLLAVRNRRYDIGLAFHPVTTVIGLFSTWAFLAITLALALLNLLPTPDVRDKAKVTSPRLAAPHVRSVLDAARIRGAQAGAS